MATAQGELVAIADADPGRLRAAADHYGIDGRFSSASELIAAGIVDGVVVALPHSAHHEVARDALLAGLHVLVEKPLTVRARDSWELVRLAKKLQRHLMVGYTLQFSRAAAWIGELIQGGSIGSLVHVAVHGATLQEAFLRGRPELYEAVVEFPVSRPLTTTYASIESGGGLAYSEISHDIGFIFFVTGGAAVSVHAFMSRLDTPVETGVVIGFAMLDGAIASVSGTGIIKPGQAEQHVHHYYGTRGSIVYDLVAGTVEWHAAEGTVRTMRLTPIEVCPSPEPARSFVDLIAGSKVNPAPGAPAARAVEVLEAAHLSATTGRRVRVDEL
jgi:predicted dehydrogenase